MSAESNKGFIRYLFVFYPIPIRPNVKNDMAEGTKKARETSDMVGSGSCHRMKRMNRMKGLRMQKNNDMKKHIWFFWFIR